MFFFFWGSEKGHIYIQVNNERGQMFPKCEIIMIGKQFCVSTFNAFGLFDEFPFFRCCRFFHDRLKQNTVATRTGDRETFSKISERY